MGTWGDGIYDNDSALDDVSRLVALSPDERDPVRVVTTIGLLAWLNPSTLTTNVEALNTQVRELDEHAFAALPADTRHALASLLDDPEAGTRASARTPEARAAIGGYCEGPRIDALLRFPGASAVIDELAEQITADLDDTLINRPSGIDLYQIAGNLAALGVLIELTQGGFATTDPARLERWRTGFTAIDKATKHERGFWWKYVRRGPQRPRPARRPGGSEARPAQQAVHPQARRPGRPGRPGPALHPREVRRRHPGRPQRRRRRRAARAALRGRRRPKDPAAIRHPARVLTRPPAMQYLSASRRVVDRDIAELDRGTRLVARRRRRTPSRNAVNLDRSRPGVETPAAPRCAGRRHLRRWSDAPASDVLPREANLLRDTPAAQARPLAEPAETATAVEPRGPADEPAIPARRARFGHYVVLQQIGEGAMGVVLDAYDPQLDRKVAIKLLRTDAHASEQARVRMRREAQTMARLSHPGGRAEAGDLDLPGGAARGHVRGRRRRGRRQRPVGPLRGGAQRLRRRLPGLVVPEHAGARGRQDARGRPADAVAVAVHVLLAAHAAVSRGARTRTPSSSHADDTDGLKISRGGPTIAILRRVDDEARNRRQARGRPPPSVAARLESSTSATKPADTTDAFVAADRLARSAT
jgi:hypothetical protein